jgi:hypothetical protein
VLSLQKKQRLLVVSGFAESPGFKASDFLSGRFIKSEYKSFFLFGFGPGLLRALPALPRPFGGPGAGQARPGCGFPTDRRTQLSRLYPLGFSIRWKFFFSSRRKNFSLQRSGENGRRLLIGNGVGGFDALAAAFAEVIVTHAVAVFGFDGQANHLFHLSHPVRIEHALEHRILHTQSKPLQPAVQKGAALVVGNVVGDDGENFSGELVFQFLV